MDRVYKIYKKMHNSKSKIVRKLLHFYLRSIYSCDIMPETVIGENAQFAHNGLGVVIHPEAVIGVNLKISQGVTIGGRNGKSVVPKIGDNVQLGANALILGPVVIGNNSIIGAGSIVLNSVPENAVVVGNPGRIIKYVNGD